MGAYAPYSVKIRWGCVYMRTVLLFMADVLDFGANVMTCVGVALLVAAVLVAIN